MADFLAYKTETHQLEFGAIKVSIDCITNVDDLLNDLISKGEGHKDFDDERLPYWADLWHAAIGLAQYLTKANVIKPGIKVTEIGCGLGLPGIVAAKLGAAVTMTDYLPETLVFLKQNWSQNFKEPLNAAILDWRKPDSAFQADILLASDVAYELRSFDVLIAALKELSKPGSRIILTEPSRAIASLFLAELENDPDFKSSRTEINIKWDGFYKKVNVLDLVKIG